MSTLNVAEASALKAATDELIAKRKKCDGQRHRRPEESAACGLRARERRHPGDGRGGGRRARTGGRRAARRRCGGVGERAVAMMNCWSRLSPRMAGRPQLLRGPGLRKHGRTQRYTSGPLQAAALAAAGAGGERRHRAASCRCGRGLRYRATCRSSTRLMWRVWSRPRRPRRQARRFKVRSLRSPIGRFFDQPV